MGLIQLSRIKRRRHGNYVASEESRRQTTVCYILPNEEGEFLQVCKKTFMETFDVTRKRLDVLINKKKLGETCFSDRRTRHAQSKFSESDHQLVKDHINSIPRDVGHYTRTKSNKEYLSPDLNINRLFIAFQKRHPSSIVTYKFYSSIFNKFFPNLTFRRPRMDTCHTCDKLDCEIRANLLTSPAAKVKLELHHRKAEKARELLKQDTIDSQQPNSKVCCLSMDLEQVMFVPTLVHSDMFYLSQLSCYNFGVHVGDTNNAFMNTWHEGFSGRGANEIASCLLHLLNSGITHKKNLVIWCDNCGGQNKNKFILFVLVFLVANGLFDSIEQRFLVSGHSFMPCDRDFGLIEKRKRNMKAFIPKDLIPVIESARYNPPFKVLDMTNFGFWNIKEPANEFFNTSKLQISKAVIIRVEKENPTNIKSKISFSDLLSWTETNILKKGKTLTNVKNIELRKLEPVNNVSENKKKCLLSMIPYLNNPEHQQFYKKLLHLEELESPAEDRLEEGLAEPIQQI